MEQSGTILSLICLNPNKFGSYEEFEIQLMKRLAQKGIRHVKAFLDFPPPNIRRQFEEAGAILDTFSHSGNRVARCRAATQLFRKYKPDVLHLAFFGVLTPMVLWAKLQGIPKIILTDHSSGLPRPKSWPVEKLFRACGKFNTHRMDRIIAVSEFVGKRLTGIMGAPPSRVRVVYNGINPERFSLVQRHPDAIPGIELPTRRPVFSVVANLIREKGVDLYIRSAEILIRQGSEGIFLIVGTGDEAENLKNLVRELNLEQRVFFLGVRSDVEKIHHFTDIFVGPSLWQEAFGLANIEAMACGLPVISTRVGAIPEVVSHEETGILIEPGSVEELVKAMQRLESDQDLRLRLGKAGRQRVIEKFNLDRQVEQTAEIFAEVLEQ